MKPIHLLIIDDDPAIRDALTQWFAVYHHCRVSTARDSDEALAHLQRHPVDAIITDINHPGIDGLTLARLLSQFDGPPVIVASGHNLAEYPHQAYAGGARAYLRKPYDLKEIRRAVDIVVNKGLCYIGRRTGTPTPRRNSNAVK